MNKNGACSSPGYRRTKRCCVGAEGAWEREYSETILLVSRGRAGSKQYIFFFINNRVLGD
jgi:hypothetical protein